VPVVPAGLVDMAKKSGLLAAVVPPKKLAGLRLGGLGDGSSGSGSSTSGLLSSIGSSAGASRNTTVSMAGKGATIGSAFGPIGAVVGAVVGAIGGAFMGSKRPESAVWDEYKGNVADVPHRGIELDNQFRNEAFVGLMRLGGKTQWPPKIKYGQKGDAAFLDAMAEQIAKAVQDGRIGAGDDANSIWTKVVEPWGKTLGGDWYWGDQNWVRWQIQLIKDMIDAYIFDQPIVATSYTTSRWANPRLSAVIAAMPQVTPASPSAPTPAPPPPAPAPTPAPTPVTGGGLAPLPINPATMGYAVVGLSPDGKTTVYKDGSGRLVQFNPSNNSFTEYSGQVVPTNTPFPLPAPAPITTTPSPAPTPQVVPTPSGPAVDVNALVQTLMQQGASNQQAFLAAMQQLQSQGVAPTAQVQQQVADQVQATAAGAGAGLPSWAKPVAIVGALVILGFALAHPKRKH
jgi:hypothetical protein